MEAPTPCDCGELVELDEMVPDPGNPRRLVCRECADNFDGEPLVEAERPLTPEEEEFYAGCVRVL